jgi:hypothetical protein
MTTKNTPILTHGKVVHDLKRRIRIISPVLSKDLERAYILEILLKTTTGYFKSTHRSGYCLTNYSF